MSRLIEADAAKAALTGWETDPTDEEIEYAIDNIPTVDAVILPCKPGDIVFYMNRYRRKVWPMKIITVEINSQGINEYGCWCGVPESYTPVCFPPIAIGETVFFTQEEAEAALEKLKEADHGK